MHNIDKSFSSRRATFWCITCECNLGYTKDHWARTVSFIITNPFVRRYFASNYVSVDLLGCEQMAYVWRVRLAHDPGLNRLGPFIGPMLRAMESIEFAIDLLGRFRETLVDAHRSVNAAVEHYVTLREHETRSQTDIESPDFVNIEGNDLDPHFMEILEDHNEPN